jgi:hypothetical protein
MDNQWGKKQLAGQLQFDRQAYDANTLLNLCYTWIPTRLKVFSYLLILLIFLSGKKVKRMGFIQGIESSISELL